MEQVEENDNWLGSWLSAAKDKSSKVLEFVKKDLEEFGNVVKSEASSVVSSTGNVIEKTLKLDSPDSAVNSMKRSFSTFIGQVNTVLNPTPDDSDTEAILIGEDSETITLTKTQKAIYELQKDIETFTTPPKQDLEKKFHCWLEIIDDQLSDERTTKHLNSSVLLKIQYCKLVPHKVSHELFWQRYLFKKALLEDEIAHQEALEKKEKKEKQLNELSLKWEPEEFASYIELSEAEQIKLLEEYDNEIKRKKSVDDIKNEDEPKNKCIEQSEMKCNKKKMSTLDKIDSAISLDTVSSTSSSDGDWEKISDVEK